MSATCPVCGAAGERPCVAQWFPGETLPHTSRPAAEDAAPHRAAVGAVVDTTEPVEVVAGERPRLDDGGMYAVVYGDSPAVVALKWTGGPYRWRELVAENPHKPRTVDGLTFARLAMGDRLHIPESWKLIRRG